MFKEMKTWPWTPKAYAWLETIKWTLAGLLLAIAIIAADWIGRTWLI
jgi:hypothetical protein